MPYFLFVAPNEKLSKTVNRKTKSAFIKRRFLVNSKFLNRIKVVIYYFFGF